MMIRMDGTYKRGEDPKDIKEEIKRWEESSGKSSEASAKFEILRSQVSDAQLYQITEEVKNTEEKERPKIIAAIARAQDRQNWNIEAMTAINREIKEARKRIFDKLVVANKRIEELLSGEPSN